MKILSGFLITILVSIFLVQVVDSAALPKIEAPGRTIIQNIVQQIVTGNLTNFTQLQDTPNSYAGAGGDCVAVNAGATALEFVACAASSIYDYNQTTPAIAYYQLNPAGYYNVTTLPASSGNASWNQSYANTLYRLRSDTINQLNISNFFDNVVTSAIGNATYQPIGISFNQTEFNFIQNLSAYTCSAGFVVNGVNSNGTVKCVADANSGSVISNATLNEIYRLKNETINQNNVSDFFNNLVTSLIGNNTYRKLSDTINQLNISNFFDNVVTSVIGNNTYRLRSDTINQNNISDLKNSSGEFIGRLFCGNITGGSDSDFCADADSGGTISNASLNVVYLNLSGTNANQNINVGAWNITSALFKGLFNWTTTSDFSFNGAVLSLSSTVSQWLYNQTTPAIDDINNRFWNRTQSYNITQINNFNASWTTTFNATYNNILGQTCPSGQLVNGTLSNGTIKCQSVTASFDNTNIAYLNNTQVFTVNQAITGSWNITQNVTIGNSIVQTYNGTCFNTYVGGTLIMSLGCA